MTNTRFTARMAVGALGVLLVGAAFTAAPRAFNPQPDPPGDVILGLTNAQVMRYGVVNLGGCKQPNAYPPGPCRVQVEVTFYDASGTPVKRGSQSVDGGRGIWFECDASLVVGRDVAFGTRAPVRASLRYLTDPAGAVLMPSVEVFDTNGIDAGKSRMGTNWNHNATFLRDGE